VDIVDIRGCIVPNLREQATAFTSNVQCLEDRIGNFDPADFNLTVDCLEERLDACRTKFNEYTKYPSRACVPPIKVNDRVHVSPRSRLTIRRPAPSILAVAGLQTLITPSDQPHLGMQWILHATTTPLIEVPARTLIPTPHHLLTTTRYHSWGGHYITTGYRQGTTGL
jgi:hypothetical protein